MVKRIYVCEKCGRDNFKNIGAAKVHEQMPIKEDEKDEYNGLAFKNKFIDSSKIRKYRIYWKTNWISKEHERLYTLFAVNVKKNLDSKKIEDVKKQIYSKKVDFAILDSKPLSEIEKEVEKAEELGWIGLEKEELSKLYEVLKERFNINFNLKTL